ncbi:VOC family protein [Variovorax rhizosphaerae]|uniref:VOC family protein n=1 Tax=Variovorax rhizosphaerae TaxID=1836200 RepID=A0ABU8WX48_9BURK
MKKFYQDILGFSQNTDGTLSLENEDCNFAIRLRYAHGELKEERDSIFEFSISENFPSYCAQLKGRGVEFDFVIKTKGNYIGCILDPSGNPIEFTCNDLTDENGIDISDWNAYSVRD